MAKSKLIKANRKMLRKWEKAQLNKVRKAMEARDG